MFYAILTLTIIYVCFSEFCYYVLGDGINKTFITQQLDQKSVIVIILQVMYSINLICTYAIMIYPCNTIIEDYLFKTLSRKTGQRTRDNKNKQIKYVLTNVSRLFVCLGAIYAAIAMKDKLDLFLSILGATLCAPLAVIYPSLFHLKNCAQTTTEKAMDVFCMVLGFAVLIFSTLQSI